MLWFYGIIVGLIILGAILIFMAYHHGKAIGRVEAVERLNRKTGYKVLKVQEQVRQMEKKRQNAQSLINRRYS